MHAENDRNEIPQRDVFGWGKRPRPRPHILPVTDIERIMQAALSLPPVASITPYTYHYLIGLLAANGHARLRGGRAAGKRPDERWPSDP
jgi:hypothetical protein